MTTKTTQPQSHPTPTTTPSAAKTLELRGTKATTSTGADGRLSLRLVRFIKAPPQRVYDCFVDPDAYAKWLPPHGFTGHVHSMDPKVGGKFRMSFATIDKSWGHTFGGVYKELVPGKRIVHTDRFEDPAMGDGEMTVTIDLKAVDGGTEVTIVQSGIPKGPAADGAPYGWSESLENLARLCEAELPF